MTATRRQIERDLIAAWPTPRCDEALRRYYDATPHPDLLIEASREHGDAYDDDDEIREVNVIATLVLIVILVAGVVLFFSTASASGPNCPNMPPDWLGWCTGETQ